MYQVTQNMLFQFDHFDHEKHTVPRPPPSSSSGMRNATTIDSSSLASPTLFGTASTQKEIMTGCRFDQFDPVCLLFFQIQN